jgi:nitroreductase
MITKALKNRWSPRAFSNKAIEKEKIDSLFEAARWAPSSMNEQPWIYYYATRDNSELYNKFIDCLVPGNQVWAKESGLIILSVARKRFSYKDRPNRHHLHDTGAANVLLAVQASEIGLQAHQMGGFDFDKTMETFKLDSEEFEPASFITVGYPGNADSLPEDLKKREVSPRVRLDRSEFVKEKI